MISGGESRSNGPIHPDRDRRITETAPRAGEQLGSDKLETRPGAIYALESLSAIRWLQFALEYSVHRL
jgi:hypothetical protein